MLEYLDAMEAHYEMTSLMKPPMLEPFSAPNDVNGYNGKIISHDMISEIYLEFVSHSRERESSDFLRTLKGEVSKPL